MHNNRWDYSEWLDDALWAYRIAFKTPTRHTPYLLFYGKACHLSVELEHQAYWATKFLNFDIIDAGWRQKFQLNELEECHQNTYENSMFYKERVKLFHDSHHIKGDKQFQVGEQVSLFNSPLRLFPSKLKYRRSRPYMVTQIFPYGAVEISYQTKGTFNINGHRLKSYLLVGDVSQERLHEEIPLHNPPWWVYRYVKLMTLSKLSLEGIQSFGFVLFSEVLLLVGCFFPSFEFLGWQVFLRFIFSVVSLL